MDVHKGQCWPLELEDMVLCYIIHDDSITYFRVVRFVTI